MKAQTVAPKKPDCAESFLDPHHSSRKPDANRSSVRRACFFLTSAPHLGALPQALVPEAAFWGRSNVGKSSVLNALMGQAALARVSKRPGCTQAINFFHYSAGLYLADLPGYGFAQVPRSVQGRWEGLVPAYLEKRPSLRKIFLLLDSRHPPQPKDLLVLDWMARLGRPYSLILTKTDRISSGVLRIRQNHLADLYPGVEVLPVSAKNRTGLDPLRLFLRGFDVQALPDAPSPNAPSARVQTPSSLPPPYPEC